MQNKKTGRTLILVILDGCRYDTSIEQMGLLNHYVENGLATRIKVISELPSNSRSLYEVLMTGVPTYKNKILTNGHNSLSGEKSIFEKVKNNGGRTAAAAYYWYSELYNESPFNEKKHRIQLDTENLIENGVFYYEDNYPDTHLFADANFLLQYKKPDFLLIHSMNIDDIGHKFTSDSREYKAVINRADYIIGQYLNNWLELGYQVMVTSDHGMDENGLHGGTLNSHREVPLYIFSKYYRNNVDEISQIEIAGLIEKLLLLHH
ncbi:alkaline phosphatase family protein [Miniphocaeibacter halophilus]|uniref:Alkaline phosphatase family protein n=1 Tax=Miniphocaeibacter halophilus TaxID=2931922 RepID=A0AC61MSK6_9FIRM|nr:alkaline phosphatase family protein [Miniphocaeibacter halophilus]QQK08619.1 alkaline phosphatase family protein [Miniphocaeibacter halophilus]